MTHNPISTPISLSHLFRLRRDERWMMLVVALLLVALNALTIIHYYGVFTPITDHYWNLFVGNFHISGFDPISYYVVSNWDARYNVYRHPLLAFMMWVPYLLNQALMWMTGINCALFIMTAIQVAAAWYAFLFLYRLLVEVMGLARTDARLLSFFLYSFAFVMVTAMVPDHFVLSLCVLLFVLYYSGLLITRRLQMSLPAAIVLFVVTAGISLNNGLKVFLSGLVVNGRRFFRPKFLLLAVVVPALVIWVGARYEYHYLVAPGENARHAAIAQKRAEQKREAQLKAQQPSPAQPAPVAAKPKPKHQPKKGKPFMQGEFMRWSDKTSPRVASVVENLFGESIQLHPDYLLQDQSRFRPMIIGQLRRRGHHRRALSGRHLDGSAQSSAVALSVVVRPRYAAPCRDRLWAQRDIHHDCPLDIRHPRGDGCAAGPTHPLASPLPWCHRGTYPLALCL